MTSSTYSNERLTALANMAITTFIRSLNRDRVSPELMERALKPGEAFVTLDSPTFPFTFNGSVPGDVIEVGVSVFDGSIRIVGRQIYPSGSSREILSHNANIITGRNFIDPVIVDSCFNRMKHIDGDCRLKTTKRPIMPLIKTPKSERSRELIAA